MIKNIVFDMGRVLITFDPLSIARECGACGDDAKKLTDEVIYNWEWIRLDLGDISEADAIASMQRRLPERLRPLAARFMADWTGGIVEIPGMKELARQLHAAGFRLFLLSNAPKSYHVYRERIEALQWFDGECISCDYSLAKPDCAFFRAFFDDFSLEPSECFFIDDSPANIESALRLGMKGFVFHGEADIPALRDTLSALGAKL